MVNKQILNTCIASHANVTF